MLAGWLFDVEFLIRPLRGGADMKLNSGLAFVLAGIALRTYTTQTRPRILGFVVALTGAVTLFEEAFGWDLRVDEFFLADTSSETPPGRMAPTTAFCFAMLGYALAASPRRSRLSHPFAIAALFVSSVAVVGYLYEVNALYGAWPYTTMAVHTAVLLMVLAVGALWRDPPSGVMAIVRAQNLGGLAARRLLLIAFTVPVLFGYLRLEGQRANLYGTDFGAALSVVFTISLLALVILSVARRIGTIDIERQEVVNNLHALAMTLEHRVEEQTAMLRNREAALRLVTEEALDAFIAIEANGRICDWNREAERIFGWSRSQVLGLRVSDVIIPKSDREAHLRGLKSFLATGQGKMVNRRMLLDAVHRDGHEIRIEMAMAAVQVDRSWRFNAFIRESPKREPA